MNTALLPRHRSLGDASRLPLPRALQAELVSWSEVGLLLCCGAASAAAVSWIDYSLKIPGHAILRAVFPMALGLAMVPRHGAGTVMGVGAIGTAAAFRWFGLAENGLGSLTSLSLIGLFLDLALRRCGNGRRVYLAFMTAGVLTNLAALSMQVAAKSFGWGGGGGKNLSAWLPFALLTYPLCGVVAGWMSAAVWFRWNSHPERQPPGNEP